MSTQTPVLHPCIEHHDIYAQVCSPLQKLGVKFFGYTAVDANGRAYCLGSDADYAEQYLLNEHAKKDVHFHQDDESQKLSYYFWDYADLSVDERAVYRLAHEHDQGHTLTISKQTKMMTHCYHFSGYVNDENINRRFLLEMDFIHAFIDYFDDCLDTISEIKNVYEHPINITPKTLDKDFIIIGDDPRMLQFDNATSHLRFKNFSSHYMTDKERTCLYWLGRGKSLAMIAQILEVSNKTIERHIASIKRKYKCYTLYQLGQKVAECGLSELLERAH